MSYEKEFNYEGLILHLEYSLGDGELCVDSWKLYKGFQELIPTRDVSEEIENFLAKWLEKEYSNFSWNYKTDFREALLEKRYDYK